MADLFAGMSISQHFYRFIPALLVLILVYALLDFTKALGKNQFVHALIAFCVAILFYFSDKATQVVSFMAPWFVVLFFFIIFVLIAFKAMGVSDSSILSAMANYKAIVWWVIAVAIIIAIIALSNVFGQDFLSGSPSYTANADGTYTAPDGTIVEKLPAGSVASSNFNTNLTSTIFHPAILGFALIGLISSFSVYFMTRGN
jgi:hypothetical protein